MTSSARIRYLKQEIAKVKDRLLSFSIIYFGLFFGAVIFQITVGGDHVYMIFAAISAIYFLLHKSHLSKELLITILATLFYLIHTLLELHVFHIDLEFLSVYGLQENSSVGLEDDAETVTLILFDIVRLMYPILRYALVFMFILGLHNILRLKRLEKQ